MQPLALAYLCSRTHDFLRENCSFFFLSPVSLTRLPCLSTLCVARSIHADLSCVRRAAHHAALRLECRFRSSCCLLLGYLKRLLQARLMQMGGAGRCSPQKDFKQVCEPPRAQCNCSCRSCFDEHSSNLPVASFLFQHRTLTHTLTYKRSPAHTRSRWHDTRVRRSLCTRSRRHIPDPV